MNDDEHRRTGETLMRIGDERRLVPDGVVGQQMGAVVSGQNQVDAAAGSELSTKVVCGGRATVVTVVARKKKSRRRG
jgi:hypothetical protein